MKIIIHIILVFLVVSCNQYETENSDIDDTTTQTESRQFHQIDSLNLIISERKLICGRKTYFNKTTPFIDSVSNKYSARILLYDRKDTILLKTVNLDTLINTIIKDDVPINSISIEDIKRSKLEDIVITPLIRGCNTYMFAKLTNESSQDIFVLFAIKTFGGNVSYKGRLWINLVSGDEEGYKYYKEQIKKPITQK